MLSNAKLLTTPGKCELATFEDFFAVAELLRCRPSMLGAVWEVEAPRGPFFRNGMLTALCERAVFYQQLPTAKRKEALAQGLAVPSWRGATRKQLYGDQRDVKGVYALARRMIEFHPSAGWGSISYGGPQIMGFNCRLADYLTAKDMFLAFRDSEKAQLKGFVGFVTRAGLVDEMQRLDYYKFARGYNGFGQVQAYGNRIKKAQQKWARRLGET